MADLVERARCGDQEGWDALVDRFASTVWAVARGYRLSVADADDVCQTTWLRLVEHLDRIEQPERVGAWLVTTARHEALRLLRLGGRQLPAGDSLEERAEAVPGAAPGDRLADVERDRIVAALVEQLPERSKRLLRMLSADEPITYAEISVALSMPIGSIGPTRMRALQHLGRMARTAGCDLRSLLP